MRYKCRIIELQQLRIHVRFVRVDVQANGTELWSQYSKVARYFYGICGTFLYTHYGGEDGVWPTASTPNDGDTAMVRPDIWFASTMLL